MNMFSRLSKEDKEFLQQVASGQGVDPHFDMLMQTVNMMMHNNRVRKGDRAAIDAIIQDAIYTHSTAYVQIKAGLQAADTFRAEYDDRVNLPAAPNGGSKRAGASMTELEG